MRRESGANSTHISPTAWLVAERKAYTDIPYAKELADAITAYQADGVTDEYAALVRPDIAPRHEARYKIIDKLLKESGMRQVIEIAAGFSGRGMAMTDAPDVCYVEIDLPDVAAIKREVVRKVLHGERPSLHIAAGDAMVRESIMAAAEEAAVTGPVVVITEGLLRYFSFPEKAVIAANIHAVLQRYGGIWITPDISLRDKDPHAGTAMQHVGAEIERLTGVSFAANVFDDAGHAQTFFEEQGFSVEAHSFMEVLDELTSPDALGISHEATVALIKPAVAFAMRVA